MTIKAHSADKTGLAAIIMTVLVVLVAVIVSGVSDFEAPDINYDATTDSGTVSVNSIFVNVSADDSLNGNNSISTFINFDNSLVSWWRMDDVTTARLCYQETANISTSCGGLATGAYDSYGYWGNPATLARDGSSN